MNHTSELIYKMLTTSTGVALCDSGGGSGRHWQKNEKRTHNDFKNDPMVKIDIDGNGYDYTISVYHYLVEKLSLDAICHDYNDLECKDWDSDIFGVSESQSEWLESRGLHIIDTINTYNGESNLSQTLQYTYVSSDGSDCPDYVLMQIHQGADVRGGYTDARLFKLENEWLCEDLTGTWGDKQISNMYDGNMLTDDDSYEEITPKEGDNIKLYLV